MHEKRSKGYTYPSVQTASVKALPAAMLPTISVASQQTTVSVSQNTNAKPMKPVHLIPIIKPVKLGTVTVNHSNNNYNNNNNQTKY